MSRLELSSPGAYESGLVRAGAGRLVTYTGIFLKFLLQFFLKCRVYSVYENRGEIPCYEKDKRLSVTPGTVSSSLTKGMIMR